MSYVQIRYIRSAFQIAIFAGAIALLLPHASKAVTFPHDPKPYLLFVILSSVTTLCAVIWLRRGIPAPRLLISERVIGILLSLVGLLMFLAGVAGVIWVFAVPHTK